MGSYNNLANLSLKEINPAIIVHVDNLMIWYSKIIKIRNDDNLVSDKKKKTLQRWIQIIFLGEVVVQM